MLVTSGRNLAETILKWFSLPRALFTTTELSATAQVTNDLLYFTFYKLNYSIKYKQASMSNNTQFKQLMKYKA